MKRLICFVLLLSLLLVGCGPAQTAENKRYSASFLTLFDTVTTVVGFAESEEAFSEKIQDIYEELEHYHQLFDIYNDYPGIHNLKTVNDHAGIAPVEVDPAIIDLLTDCKTYYEMTGGKVNVAMGSVLQLWHEARNEGINDPVNASLPDAAALEAAADHCDLDAVMIDEAACTVYISDPGVRLDVGAIAKGWATQKISETAPPGMLISVGGNVCATGPKDNTGTPWVVGIQNPDGTADDYLHTVYCSRGSVVTSGDYQRAYTVDGVSYHHIIDPDTLFPAGYWRSVTVICPDSGLADALSTALFLVSQEEGQQLLEQCGAEAMWVDREGNCFYSSGFEANIRT